MPNNNFLENENYYTTDEDENKYVTDDDGNEYLVLSEENNEISLYKYLSNKVNFIIPNEIKKGDNILKIVSISDHAFSSCLSLKSIKIPNSVTSIGNYTFQGCSSLESINIPDSIMSIGISTFYDCSSLKSIKIPNSVTSIDASAFSGCSSLASINIPDSVTSIGTNAFVNCSFLKSINIPNSVTSIGTNAFQGCSSLKKIKNYSCENMLTCFSAQTQIKFLLTPEQSISNNKIINLNNLFKETLSVLKIIKTDENNHYSIEGFEGYKNLQYIELSDNINTISNSAFNQCSLLFSINLNNVKEIGEFAFKECKQLSSIKLKSIESIGKEAFSLCTSLKLVEFGDNSNFKTLPVSCFQGCSSLKEISIPDSITTIEKECFRNCSSIVNINFSSLSNISEIGEYSFRKCVSLTEFYVPKSIAFIKQNSFLECVQLKNIFANTNKKYYDSEDDTEDGDYKFKDDNGVLYCYKNNNIYLYLYPLGKTDKTLTLLPETTGVFRNAFVNCDNLFQINLNEGLEEIAYNSFQNCINLTNIYIPSSVSIIDEGAFLGCTNLSSIVISENNGNYKNDSNGAVVKKSNSKLIIVPSGKDYSKQDFNMDGISNIGDYAFLYNSTIKSISGESTDYIIYKYTVDGNNEQKKILLYAPNGTDDLSRDLYGVDEIGAGAFFGKNISNNNNTSYTFEGKTIKTKAFSNANFSNVTELAFNNTLIEENAFLNVTGINEITLGNTDSYDKKIGDNCFNNIDTLTAINVIAPNNKIGKQIFKNCINIKEVTLSDFNFAISKNFFGYLFGANSKSENNNIAKDFVNKDMTIRLNKDAEIPEYAFVDCDFITEIYYNSTIASIGEYAFSNCINLSKINVDSENDSNYDSNYDSNINISNDESIGKYAFSNCKLISVKINEINKGIFSNCESISKIMTPGFNYLGYIFGGSSSDKHDTVIPKTLKTVIFSETLSNIEASAFKNCSYIEEIYTNNNNNSISINNGCIGESAFQNCKNLTNIKFTGSISKINNFAFRNCSNLEELSFEVVNDIGDNVFLNSPKIKKVSITDDLSSIKSDNDTFLYKSKENTISLLYYAPSHSNTDIEFSNNSHNNITKICENAFYQCNNLKNIIINKDIEIEEKAFYECDNIISVTLPAPAPTGLIERKDITQWFGKIFGATSYFNNYKVCPKNLKTITLIPTTTFTTSTIANSDNLAYLSEGYFYMVPAETITIPNIYSAIGAQTFRGCTSLSSLIVGEANTPSLITKVDTNGFRQCKKLPTDIFSNTLSNVTEIGENSFKECFTDDSFNDFVITLPEELSLIQTGAFSQCDKIIGFYYSGSSDKISIIDDLIIEGGVIESV